MYQFVDKAVEGSNIYDYRLADVDYNGITNYHSLTVLAIQVVDIPAKYVLYPACPNPFNPITTIDYGLPEDGFVTLKIYDVLGREINTLVNNERKEVGYYKVTWNGTDRFEQSVSTGMYFIVMQSGSFRDVKKMVLLK